MSFQNNSPFYHLKVSEMDWVRKRMMLIQHARDDIRKKSIKVSWGDDDTEMDFLKPLVFKDEEDNMDLSD